MANAPMASHPVPHGNHHPGMDQLAEDFGRTNVNSPPIQQGFPRHEAPPYQPMYYGFLLTKSKTSSGKAESWELIQKTALPVSEDKLVEELKRDKKKGVSALAVYAHRDMSGYKRQQVDLLIKNMTLHDPYYPAYEYTLALLRPTEGRNPKGQRITVSLRIILKRQPAPDGLPPRVDSETVDLKKPQDYFPRHQGERVPPPPPVPSAPYSPQFDPYPENGPFPPQSGRYTPQSTRSSTPPSGGLPMPQEPFRPGPSHPIYPGGGQAFEQEGFRYGDPPGQQPEIPKNDGKANAGNGKGKAGDDGSKNLQFKTDKPGQAYPGLSEFESDSSDGLLSDDSLFSASGTIRTADTELSGRSKEQSYRSDQRDGHRSSHGSRERNHYEYEGGNHGDHTSRRRDNRNSRSSHSYEKDSANRSTRQHRRKSSPFSSNSSSSSGYLKDKKIHVPHNSNSRRARRGSEYLSDERPEFDSRRDSYGSRYSNEEKPYGHLNSNSRRARRGSESLSDERPDYESYNSYEESRLPRQPRVYPGNPRSGNNPRRVELYDDRSDLTETVEACVQKVMEDLRRENERLRDGRNRPEPMINERERLTRGPGHLSAYSELPRSRRLSADLRNNRYHY